jgi:DNA-binding MarR family transcriptional regulator
MKLTELQYADQYPNMSLRGCMVLLVLRGGDMDFSEMACKIGLYKSALSRALDMLTGYKLARREYNSDDRRKVVVSLTVLGKSFVDAIGG